MLDAAAESGTRAMVATPHSDLRYQFDASLCRGILGELQGRRTDGPRLYLGCELHLTPENVSNIIRDPAGYTLNGSDCALLELPDRIAPPMVNPALDAMTCAGLRVIIAHPERNLYLQQQRSWLDRLVESGCYLQLTARSLDGASAPRHQRRPRTSCNAVWPTSSRATLTAPPPACRVWQAPLPP